MLTGRGEMQRKRYGFYLTVVVLEISYVFASFNGIAFLTLVLGFPAVFIAPGVSIIVAIGDYHEGLSNLVTNGFLLSTPISTLLTVVFHLTNLPMIPITFAITCLAITVSCLIVANSKKCVVKSDYVGKALVLLAMGFFVAMCAIFMGIPRLFSADESSYIFNSLLGAISGEVPLMGALPHHSDLVSFFRGRYLWSYMLTTFIASTGIPVFKAGLLNVGFLAMIALASSTIPKERGLQVCTFALVALNAILVSFSGLALNDLAIGFYIVVAVKFFVEAVNKHDSGITLDPSRLVYSACALVFLTLIKPNILIIVSMWFVLVGLILKDRLFRKGLNYKLLSALVLIPPLAYELLVDIPYVIGVWFLRDSQIVSIVSPFMVMSPIEMVLGNFLAPWWNPGAQTIFTISLNRVVICGYLLITPETHGLLISALILMLPIFWVSTNKKIDYGTHLMTMLLTISLGLFYFEVVTRTSLSDVIRYSLWLIPLWIPTLLVLLKTEILDGAHRKRLLVFLGMFAILVVNMVITSNQGGTPIGYLLPSHTGTTGFLVVQFVVFSAFLAFGSLKQDAVTRIVLRLWRVQGGSLTTGLIVIVLLVSSTHVSSFYIGNSQRYQDHGLVEMGDIVNELVGPGELVLANNFIYFRNYFQDNLAAAGFLMAPPETESELRNMISILPNGSVLVVSDDPFAAWYEYANSYMPKYVESAYITPYLSDGGIIPLLDLPSTVLSMSYDDDNSSVFIDESGYANHGLNIGATIVAGYHGDGLAFNGSEYVSIPSSDSLNIGSQIAISFYASIERIDSGSGYTILSKGYAVQNGSYDVFIWDGSIFFELGGVGSVSVPAGEYLGTWHHYLMTYNGTMMQAYVDGVLVATKYASGAIRPSTYPLEIGRDGEREYYYYEGLLDEVRISNETLSDAQMIETWHDCYAKKVDVIESEYGTTAIFQVVREDSSQVHTADVEPIEVHIDSDYNVEIKMDVTVTENTTLSVLVGTNRFTKHYAVMVTEGASTISLTVPYLDNETSQPDRTYWPYMSQVFVHVLGSTVLYSSGLLSIQNVERITTTFSIAMVTMLIVLVANRSGHLKRSCFSIITRLGLRRTKCYSR